METGVIRDSVERNEQEITQKQAVEKRYKIQTVYRPRELERRVRENAAKIWYVPMLAYYFQNADFNAIRNLNFYDALICIEHIISTLPVKSF